MEAKQAHDRAKATASLPDEASGLGPSAGLDHPARVFLFSGHMIDRPDRPEPRFPADKAPIAAARISEALDALGAGPGDIAFAQAAADGEAWRQRYFALCDKLSLPIRVMPPSFGNDIPSTNPFELCNRWLLDSALAQGAGRLAFICLWNGDDGDAAGGTAHMVKEVQRHGGQVIWLDTRELW